MKDNAINAALRVMDAHIDALNNHDAQSLSATLHFPHHRLGETDWKTWETAEHYFSDFLNRAGGEWKRSEFKDIKVIDSSANKVHLNAEVRRYNENDKLITSFRSLWVITEFNGIWAAKIRSSFAPPR